MLLQLSSQALPVVEDSLTFERPRSTLAKASEHRVGTRLSFRKCDMLIIGPRFHQRLKTVNDSRLVRDLLAQTSDGISLYGVVLRVVLLVIVIVVGLRLSRVVLLLRREGIILLVVII